MKKQRTSAYALLKPMVGDRWEDDENVTRFVTGRKGVSVQYRMYGNGYEVSIYRWRKMHANALFLGGAE